MRVFITGATGLLGRHLVEHLLAQGDEVTALARTFDRARALPAGVRTWAGDVTRPAGLRAGMRAGTAGAEVVYHLAAAREPGRRARDLVRLERINVEGTRAVLRLAAEAGAGRVIYVSDLAAEGDAGGGAASGAAGQASEAALTPYAASKRRAQAAAAEALRAGAPVTMVSLGALVGAGDAGWLGRLLGRYARRRLWVGVGGESAYSFVSARDAAAGLRLAAVRGAAGETYTLAGPRLTLREFFAEAQRATGLPAPRVWLPSALARLAGRALARVRPDLAEAASHFAGGVTAGDAGKAERELGWRAGPLGEALREAVATDFEAD